MYLPYVAMTANAVFLPLLFLLLLCCHGNWLFDALLLAEADQLKQADIPGTATARQADPDDQSYHHRHNRSRKIHRRSSCGRLGRFLSCYAVVPVSFPDVLGDAVDSSGRPVEVPIMLTALGRPFNLRLRADDLSGKGDKSERRTTWSSVISPSVVVSVIGETRDDVREFRTRDSAITWYSGYDSYEVAPSSVLASVVRLGNTRLFRAVVRTASDVYYVEPASDYDEV